ncbi:DUF5753 domain-containing protein [Streptomyces flavidovirens]
MFSLRGGQGALRFLGTTSDGGDCPTLYEVEQTRDILVQGDKVTDPELLVKLRGLKESETFVVVPRDLLTRFAPRTEASAVVPFAEATHLFRDFKHTAWRLETRGGYASDRNSSKWQRWQAGEDVAAEPFDEWRLNVQRATEEGRRFERVRIVDDPLTEGQQFLLTTARSNVRQVPRDIEDAVRARIRRQEALCESGRRFRFLVWEGALHVLTCPREVMASQLDRLAGLIGLDTIELGVIPFGAQLRRAPTHGFWIYDQRLVIVETVSTEMWLVDEETIQLYGRAWEWLAEAAVQGQHARRLIGRARAALDHS